MAQVVELGDNAGSNLVTGTGTNSVTFTLPASPRYVVQSVVATINNAAGTDATATLTMKDTNGEVIAANAQDDPIPAGGTGTATFALRLAGNGGGIRFRKINTGEWLEIVTTGEGGDFGGGWGITLVAENKGIVIDAGTSLSIFADNGDSVIDLEGDLTMEVTGTGLYSNDGPVTVVYSAGATIQLDTGTALTVVDASSSPIFRINENGSIHGRAAVGAITWDL